LAFLAKRTHELYEWHIRHEPGPKTSLADSTVARMLGSQIVAAFSFTNSYYRFIIEPPTNAILVTDIIKHVTEKLEQINTQRTDVRIEAISEEKATDGVYK
jgi:hypothetical protein